ncbi:MAG: DUF2723 domain-containing protein, partial [Dehalococcoidia bacterium]
HPPGYPTYVLLGRLFAFLPFGEVAFRTNLMSAFFGAAAVALLYLIVLEFISLARPEARRRLGLGEILSAGLAPVALATSPLFWSQAIITEVYALNAFLVTAITLLLVRRAVRGSTTSGGLLRDRYLLGAAFLLGLGLGNHITILFLAPPALLLIAAKWGRKSLTTLPGAVAALLLGLAIYVYLPISAAQDPAVNWGQANQLSGFWWTVSATPYRQFAFNAPAELWADRLKDWWGLLVDQFSYPGVALGLVGAWWLWRRHLLGGLFTVGFVLLLIIYAGTYNTPDSYVYLVPVFATFALWIGLGLYWALTEAIPWLWKQRQLARYPRAYGPTLALAVVLAAAFVPIHSLAANYSDQDLSDDSVAVDYGRRVLQTVESDALVIADSDSHIFSLWYTLFVSEPQSQVILITQNLLLYDWYTVSVDERYPGILPAAPGRTFQERLPNLIKVNVHKRPIYLTDRTPSNDFVFQQFDIEPVPLTEGSGQLIYLVQGERQASP